jgi:predicted DNA-binding transcriptional regulator AlpA
MNTSITPAVQQFDTLSPSILLSIAEASAVSGRSRASIYRHFKAGELSQIKIGNSTRVRVGELRRLIGAA